MNIIKFDIPGAVTPKGRPRLGRYGVYSPKNTAKYEKFVAGHAMIAMIGKKPLTGYLSLSLQIMEKVPESYSGLKKKRCLAGDFFPTRNDLDNCIKSLTDSMNAIVYNDDRQIVHIEAMRSYGDAEKCSIIVRDISNIKDIG